MVAALLSAATAYRSGRGNWATLGYFLGTGGMMGAAVTIVIVMLFHHLLRGHVKCVLMGTVREREGALRAGGERRGRKRMNYQRQGVWPRP